ncbi:hypothetical protein HEB94_005500 [Actinopolymorpha pittospori]|uniref:Uncharacterized protein n=1 Tax=Actinopolymorpha pittospori TaxID=648752 RepID=A0A927N480_9ACTN|nr:hypothetical protein [Actinopolymorpha pittospori]
MQRCLAGAWLGIGWLVSRAKRIAGLYRELGLRSTSAQVLR